MIQPTTKAEILLAEFLLDAVSADRYDQDADLVNDGLRYFDLDQETDDGLVELLASAIKHARGEEVEPEIEPWSEPKIPFATMHWALVDVDVVAQKLAAEYVDSPLRVLQLADAVRIAEGDECIGTVISSFIASNGDLPKLIRTAQAYNAKFVDLLDSLKSALMLS